MMIIEHLKLEPTVAEIRSSDVLLVLSGLLYHDSTASHKWLLPTFVTTWLARMITSQCTRRSYLHKNTLLGLNQLYRQAFFLYYRHHIRIPSNMQTSYHHSTNYTDKHIMYMYNVLVCEMLATHFSIVELCHWLRKYQKAWLALLQVTMLGTGYLLMATMVNTR